MYTCVYVCVRTCVCVCMYGCCESISHPLFLLVPLAVCSEIETVFIPWLMEQVQQSTTKQLVARTLLDGE